jgi:hypothetical protein
MAVIPTSVSPFARSCFFSNKKRRTGESLPNAHEPGPGAPLYPPDNACHSAGNAFSAVGVKTLLVGKGAEIATENFPDSTGL